MLLAFALIFFLAGAGAWTIGILLIALILFFWYLPTFMELIEVPTNLTVAEGPMDERQLPLDYRWQEGEDDFRLDNNPGHLLLLVVVCAGLLLLIALLYSLMS